MLDLLDRPATMTAGSCKTCLGFGYDDQTGHDEDGTPNADPCESCLTLGLCPRCGSGPHESLETDAVCPACGWSGPFNREDNRR